MRKFTFTNSETFLKKMDGKIYAIADTTNENIICDLLETTFIKFVRQGKIINRLAKGNENLQHKGNASDYILSDDKYAAEIYANRIEMQILAN